LEAKGLTAPSELDPLIQDILPIIFHAFSACCLGWCVITYLEETLMKLPQILRDAVST